MAKQKEAWDKLSMLEKALLIKLSVDNGVSSLKLIRDTYNLYSSGNLVGNTYDNSKLHYAKGGPLVHKYDGDSEKFQWLGIKGRMKDIAYRAMSQGPAESRNRMEVLDAVRQSYRNAPYELNYLGTHMYGDGFGEADPDLNRDSNWLFLYGNTKGHYTPITKEDYRGHSYAPFIKKHYPRKKVLNYYGNFTPVQEVGLPSYTRPLIEFLAKKDLGTYESVLDAKNDEEFNKYISSNITIDDTGAFRTGVGYSPQGNPEFQLSDLRDFAAGYKEKWGTLAGIQGQLLTLVGNPFMLRQYIPIKYTDNPDEINESGMGTLLKIAEDNKVASYNPTDDTFEMLGSLPEVDVTASKSTGGPLYPFSFEKNPFLKTPAVRYDEGGKKLDASNSGGYTDEQLNKNYLIWKTYDPTGGLDFFNYFMSLNFGNMARGEENEYWKEYLGLPSAVPHMNSNANTEWDKKIEQEKIANGELASDFYGTTPRMDYNILALADTLMLGEMVRNYEKYNLEYNLPHIESLTKAYDLAKTILNNPNKWTQVNGEIEVSNWPFNPNISESNPLGMLANFGMKWVPEENALYMHDTYDFPSRVHKRTEIPVRPREMKIRSKISFDPTKGSWLLRSPVNYNTEIQAQVIK